jgi:hypothetical protein
MTTHDASVELGEAVARADRAEADLEIAERRRQDWRLTALRHESERNRAEAALDALVTDLTELAEIWGRRGGHGLMAMELRAVLARHTSGASR